jgi:beta-glucanase (GH16 family)
MIIMLFYNKMQMTWNKRAAKAIQHLLLTLILTIPVLCRADWQLVWSDEFNQPDGSAPNPANWGYDLGGGGWGNNELETYTSTNAWIQSSQLVIHVNQSISGSTTNYTSTRMKTQNKVSWLYGRIEASIKIPRGQGIWPAFWMLGTNINNVSWPSCGEIDIMENIGKVSDQGTDHGTIHGPQGGGDYNGGSGVGSSTTLPGGAALADNFHIYAVEWTTNQIKWFLDSSNFFTATPANLPSGGTWVFTNFQFVILNVAVGGQWPGYPDSTTVFPQQMIVDYVRAYKYVPSTNPPAMPTGFTASPGNGTVYLNWNASSGATAYNVKRSTVSGGPYTTIASPTANNYTDTSAPNCSTYYYVVSATNSFGESTNSSEQAAVEGAFALAVNSGGSAAGQFSADAYFSGGTQAAPVTAGIDTSAVTAPAPQAVYQSQRYGNFTYTFTGLTSGVNYKVRLHFAETYWTGVGQRKFNVSINGTQVLANFDIYATAGAANKATIQEFMATANGSGQITIQYTTVTDNAMSCGIEIILPQPAAPAGLTAVPADSQISLTWNQVAGATYNVKRSQSGNGPFIPVYSGLTTTNYIDSGLTDGVTYYYVVSAVILGCESSNSLPINATPACTPPSAPAGLMAVPADSQVSLTWNQVAGSTYNVKRSLASNGPFTNIFNGLAITNCTDTGLTDGVTYYYVVSAVSLSCESSNSLPINATPTCTPPPAPTAGNNGPIWAGTTLNLTASTVPGATYNWTGPNGFSSTSQNPSITNVTTDLSGQFSVTATTGSCTSLPGTTTVTVNPLSNVTVQFQSGSVILSWPNGFLQSTPDLNTPWSDVIGATSPFTNPAAASQQFYRLRLQ